ncbi:MAG: hypothetical protein HY819_05590 [Acidobacteria bacterium]|nr:hypothetical protein [Acidobacteriota bacterium]
MVYKMNISFEGLFAFVSNEETKVMVVLVIDARKPEPSKKGKRFLVHVPSVQVNVDDLVPKQGVNPLDSDYILSLKEQSNFEFFRRYIDKQDNTVREAVWPLDKDLIYINPTTSPKGVTLAVAPDLEERIPTMKYIYRETPNPEVIVDSNCLNPPLDPRLVAKMRFNSGIVKAVEPLDHKFEFYPGDPDISKEYHRKVVVELEFEQDTVELGHLSDPNDDLKNPKSEFTKVFTIKLSQEKTVEIKVQNLPPNLQDVFDYNPVEDFLPEYDFELVYEVVNSIPEEGIKVPRKIPNAGENLLSSDRQMCGHALFFTTENI